MLSFDYRSYGHNNRYIGVLLKEHYDLAFRKESGRLRLLKKIRSSLTMDAAESMYKYLIMPLLTYFSVVTLNLNATSTSGIENLQDRASRVINPICLPMREQNKSSKSRGIHVTLVYKRAQEI